MKDKFIGQAIFEDKVDQLIFTDPWPCLLYGQDRGMSKLIPKSSMLEIFLLLRLTCKDDHDWYYEVS